MKCSVAERAQHFDDQFYFRGLFKTEGLDQFQVKVEKAFNDPKFHQASTGQGKQGPKYDIPVESSKISGRIVVIAEMFRQCHLRLVTVWRE